MNNQNNQNKPIESTENKYRGMLGNDSTQGSSGSTGNDSPQGPSASTEDILYNAKEVPEALDEFAPEQNPEEVTIAITSDIDTIKAIELLFAPNIEELQETQPELFQYYSLFGAAEGLLRSAKLLSYAAPDHPEIAESIAAIAKVVSQTGIEMFNDAKETLAEQEKLNLTTSNSMEKIKMNSNQVKNIMDQIGKIDVSLPDHLK